MSDIRYKIIESIHSNLIGPQGGEGEVVIGRAPLLNYISGKLYAEGTETNDTTNHDDNDGSNDAGSNEGDSINSSGDEPLSDTFQSLPSSAGISFCIKNDTNIEIEASCGIYEPLEEEDDEGEKQESDENNQGDKQKAKSKHRRLPYKDRILIDRNKKNNPLPCFDERAELLFKITPLDEQSNIVTVTLRNSQIKDLANILETTLFQIELKITSIDNMIEPYPTSNNSHLNEEELEMQLRYIHDRPYARGWNVSVDWDLKNGSEGAQSVQIAYFPKEFVHRMLFEIPSVDSEIFEDDHIFNLAYLSNEDSDKSDVIEALNNFANFFEKWIKNLQPTDEMCDTSESIIKKINTSLKRIRSGINALEDDLVYSCFQLANYSMLIQMAHFNENGEQVFDLEQGRSLENLDYKTYKQFNWRPFQLAYFLLTLESVIDEENEDRNVVDLIWFQTGGGKTEAYLLVAAFEMIHRRIKFGEKGLGTAIINRYTLRFLTTDQFTRTARLICALERIRRDPDIETKLKDRLLNEPFTLGLWVGKSVTPNKLDRDIQNDDDLSARGRLQNMKENIGNPERFLNYFQIESCPSCATKLYPASQMINDDGEVNELYWGLRYENNRFMMFCPNDGCLFNDTQSGGLPLLVIDDQIYEQPPTFLMGTIDKFANLAWEKRSKKIVTGNATVMPPSLIIQDELHLITGSLGTLAAIYESSIDTIANLTGSKPKYIAATATIKNSTQQCRRIFARKCKIFPSPGLSMNDSFFSIIDQSENTARMYLGLMGSMPGTVNSFKTMAAMLQVINEIDLSDEEKNAFWTLLTYHNSIRELGRTISTYGDEIPAQMKNYASTQDKIRKLKGELYEVSSKAVKSISDARAALLKEYEPNNNNAYDFVPCTNMISVGIDIQRLSYMFVNGHPKMNSEYIQATSRVGRGKIPGLVITNYSAFKPRDRSFFEQFKTFHQTIHREVEPTTVTPGSVNAMKKALHAALIIAVRFGGGDRFLEDSDAINFDVNHPVEVIDALKNRLSSSYEEHEDEKDQLVIELDSIIEKWISWCEEYRNKNQNLTYRHDSRQTGALIYDVGKKGKKIGWATLRSMRHVDQEVELNDGNYGNQDT